MNREKRLALIQAADLLCLDDYARRDEIKKAYRRLCKKYHPDINASDIQNNNDMIRRLTDAYELLMSYCNEYTFLLRPEESSIDDAEDWWFERFGQDPLWGKNRQD